MCFDTYNRENGRVTHGWSPFGDNRPCPPAGLFSCSILKSLASGGGFLREFREGCEEARSGVQVAAGEVFHQPLNDWRVAHTVTKPSRYPDRQRYHASKITLWIDFLVLGSWHGDGPTPPQSQVLPRNLAFPAICTGRTLPATIKSLQSAGRQSFIWQLWNRKLLP